MTVAIKEPEVEKAAPPCDQTAAHDGVTAAADVPHPQHHSSKHARHAGAKKQARETRKLTTAYVVAGVVFVIVALVLGGHRAAQVRLTVGQHPVYETCRSSCQLHTFTSALQLVSSSFIECLVFDEAYAESTRPHTHGPMTCSQSQYSRHRVSSAICQSTKPDSSLAAHQHLFDLPPALSASHQHPEPRGLGCSGGWCCGTCVS